MQAIKNPDHYITLHHAQFKTPIEVLRKNFKNLQKLIEKQNKHLNHLLSQSPLPIKEMITSQETFTKKLRIRVKQHNDHVEKLKLRMDRAHRMKQLWDKYGRMTTSQLNEGVPLELLDFYREETNLLIAEYLIHTSNNFVANTDKDVDDGGGSNIAVVLAKGLGVSDLIDTDVIFQGLKIRDQIVNGHSLKLLKLWCIENRKNLKASREQYPERLNDGGDIEFECDLQEFLQLIQSNQFDVALMYAKKYLEPFQLEEQIQKVARGGSIAWAKLMLKDRTDSNEGYKHYYRSRGTRKASVSEVRDLTQKYMMLVSPQRWEQLGDQFISNFKALYGIEERPLLVTMLNIGGSTMKTKACKLSGNIEDDGKFADIINQKGTASVHAQTDAEKLALYYGSSKCPICSPLMKHLLNSLPYTLQTRSNIYDDPIILPNDHIYSFRELIYLNRSDFNNQNLGVMNDVSNSDYTKGDNADSIILAQIVEPSGKLQISPFDKSKVKFSDYVARRGQLTDPVTGQSWSIRSVEKVFPS